MSWINKYIIGDDVKVSDASHRFNLFEIIGPQSESFLSLFVGDSITSVTENSFKVVSADGVLFFLLRLRRKMVHLSIGYLQNRKIRKIVKQYGAE